MVNIDSVSFDTKGWQLTEQDAREKIWAKENGDWMVLRFLDVEPDIQGALSKIDKIRDQYRKEALKSHGALIEVEECTLATMPALRNIIKSPQDPSGMSYAGSFIIPRRRFSFVILVLCREHGMTGIRDNRVRIDLHNSGEMPVTKESFFASEEEWASDPYDPDFEAGVLRNRSDDEEWDAHFPDHPLSVVRRTMQSIADSIVFDEEVVASEPFEGPGFSRRVKLWWQRLTKR